MDKKEILALLRTYKSRYAQQYGILSLGVFGSFAREQNREDSDLDICVTTTTPNPFVLAHIKEDLEHMIRRRVDIVRFRDRMNPYLKQRIERECIYV